MKTTLLLLVAVGTMRAAVPTTAVFNVIQSATAANANGGGFDLGNANFMTDLDCASATGASPTCTSATYTFLTGGAGTGDVGAWLFIQSGTGYVAYRACPIASVSGGTATLSAAAGACTDFSTSNSKPTVSTTDGIGTTANPSNVGVFGIMYNMRGDPHFTYTDIIVGSTTTQVTSVAHPFGPNFIGNSIHILSGSGCTFTAMSGVLFVDSVAISTATLNSTAGTAASTCVANGPGAFSLQSSTTNQTDDQTMELSTASATHANRWLIKYSATQYTIPATTTIAAAGNAANQIVMEGYSSVPGDHPVRLLAPFFNTGTAAITFGGQWRVNNMRIEGSAANLVVLGASNILNQVYIVNHSATASQGGVAPNTANTIIDSELISYRGRALNNSSATTLVVGSYLHDSDVCLQANAAFTVVNSILADCVTYGINTSSTAVNHVYNSTIVGGLTAIGIALNAATTSINRLFGNIIYGFVTPLVHADAGQSSTFSNYNDYYNNSNPNTNVNLGLNDKALDPAFVSLTVLNDASAGGFTVGTCGASDNTLTLTGGDFGAAGVVAGVHVLRVLSGTNSNNWKFGIVTVGTTTLVLDADCSSSTTASNMAWSITMSRNYAIGTALKALGFPGAFPGGATTAYTDIGGVQRQEVGGGGSGTRVYPLR